MSANLLEFSHGSVTLNEEQYRVVISPPSENQRILASAGSGKTTTITARISYLVEEHNIDPSRILLVSFSRSAAQEMIHRVHQLIGMTPTYAGTFHALSSLILRERSPQSVADQPFIDELPYRLVAYLQTEQGKKWSKRFHTIIVDEFQDINEIQWQILKGFYHAHTSMTIVGDDAQNIYTWRGSSVDFILNFHTHLKNVNDYQLCMNYRSTEAIVTIANSVMRFIPTLPFKEKMVAYVKGGRKPDVHFFFRAVDEQDWIVQSVEKVRALYPEFKCAVLSRYNSDLFKVEERLHLKGIPYDLLTVPCESSTRKKKAQVTLATIHASKGLEWDVVFFMNLHDEVFPSRKTDADLISERRLFYVGVTRARKALYLTYSRHERSLSRFVREIPRPFLTFHNVTSFKLSTTESSQATMSLDDMLQGLDGADWNMLRKQGSVPMLQSRQTESIYQFGQLFSVPEWVKEHDIRETWYEMLRWITLRECALYQNTLDQLITPEIQEGLLTLRIYKEDVEFWEQYETELEHLVHRFMVQSSGLKTFEYVPFSQYVKAKLPHLNWVDQDMTHAFVIIAKIRGQLRPLRHMTFDLNEFTFGVIQRCVPTELRPDVLASWHRLLDPTQKTHDIVIDIWRIATIQSVVEGRNIPLYQTPTIAPFLVQQDHLRMIHAMERAIPIWVTTQDQPTFHFMMEADGVRPIRFDIMTEKCAYDIFFNPLFVPSQEDNILLLLKQYVYEELFDRVLDSIGFFNVATGIMIHYEVTPTIREQLSQMWQHLQQKYHLFSIES
jgi:hypothetical protein